MPADLVPLLSNRVDRDVQRRGRLAPEARGATSRRRAAPRSARRARPIACVLSLAALLSGGCAGVRWDDYKFDRTQLARNPQRPLTLVYFRHWSAIDCTDFEERTLKDARVIKAMAEMTCIMLDYYWDKPLADSWSIPRPPAAVILNARGDVLERQSGLATPDAFLAKLEAAKRAETASTRPRGAPP